MGFTSTKALTDVEKKEGGKNHSAQSKKFETLFMKKKREGEVTVTFPFFFYVFFFGGGGGEEGRRYKAAHNEEGVTTW